MKYLLPLFPRSLQSRLMTLGLLAACAEPALDAPVARSEQDASVALAATDTEEAETASCPDGETLVGGEATCKYSLNSAEATGSHVYWQLFPNWGECGCYIDTKCGFNDKSTVCAGGSLATGETYPCTAELDTTSYRLLKIWTKDQYNPKTHDGCKASCAAYVDSLTVTEKNTAARESCQPPASKTVKPISCCMPDPDESPAETTAVHLIGEDR